MENLLPAVKVHRPKAAVAAGQTQVLSDGVNKDNAEGIMFIVAVGAITATGTVDVKAQQSDDDGVADAYSDLEGSALAQLDDTKDDSVAVLDIKRPQKRYVRIVVDRGTANSVIDGIIAIKYGARKQPVEQPGGVAASEVHGSPDEGTA